MKKRILSLSLASMVFLGSLSGPIHGERINLELNNEDFQLTNSSFLENGHLYLPVREVGDGMGYEVKWDLENKSVDLLRGSESLRLYLNGKDIILNGKEANLNQETLVKNSRLYTSVDTFSEYLKNLVALNKGYEKVAINQLKTSEEDFFKESTNKDLREKLNSYVEAYVDHQNFQGSVLIAKDEEILLNKGYGYSNKDQAIKNKSQTKFAIGSITKQFVATGIVQLEEKGSLNFEDKLSKYMDGFKDGDKITLHNLLTHSSGLVNVTNLADFYSLEGKGPQEAVELAKGVDLSFKPGEAFEYNNTNYILLGMILEQVSGLSLEEYFHKNFFEPVGMKDTGIAYGKRPGFNIASPYQGYIETYEVDDRPLLANAYGAGNVYSTVEDMYRWNQALEGDKILSKSGKEKLFKGHTDMGKGVKYAYGWMVSSNEGKESYQHDGSTLGFSALSTKLVTDDLTVIILGNRRLLNLYSLSAGLQNIVYGLDVKLEDIAKLPKEIDMDPKEYKKYEGEYVLVSPMDGSNMAMNILGEDGAIFLQMEGQDRIEIFPLGDDKFFTKILESGIEFVADSSGAYNELVFTQMGIKFKGTRQGHLKEEVKVPFEILNKYIGLYKLEEGLDMKIDLRGEDLFVSPTDQPSLKLVPISDTKFEIIGVDASIDFKLETDGSVRYFDYVQGSYRGIGERK